VRIEDWLSLECGYLYPGVPKEIIIFLWKILRSYNNLKIKLNI